MRRLFAGLSLAGIACEAKGDRAQRAPEPEFIVSVAGGSVTAPATAGPGWTRLRVTEDGEGHILVVFRLHDGVPADASAFLAALDTARGTPPAAIALGGPEMGDSGEVVLRFRPGTHVIACVRRGEDGHRHGSRGEAKVFVVAGDADSSGADSVPVATQTVRMLDFAYGGSDRWPAGAQLLRIENAGREDHQLRLVRLHDGTTVSAWMNAEEPGDHATDIAGVARIGPSEAAYLRLDLAPGTYVLYCLVPDLAEGRPHVALGMLKVVQVEAGGERT